MKVGTTTSRVGPRPRRSGAIAARGLDRLSDEALLDLRFCDLDLRIEGSPLAPRLQRALDELRARGLRFRPHFWLSSEWFTPDGVPGVAIPFYLAHPRLTRLERRQMLEADGASTASCLRILRHEIGHALDNAYGLHRRRDWQRVFGRASRRYPNSYRPRPASRRFVLHLSDWYAQSHPAEDFAETFAVWLTPGTAWRSQYLGWPAMRKLEYVDELMTEIARRPPRLKSRRHVEPLEKDTTTLRDHYARRRARYGVDEGDVIDRHLRRLFSAHANGGSRRRVDGRSSAAAFLRRIQGAVRRRIARWTGEHQYTVDQVFQRMIARSRRLNLRLTLPEDEAALEAAILVAVQTMHDLHAGRGRVLL